MTDSRPILFIIGILMSTLALAMCLPAVADAAVYNPDWKVFALASAFTLLIGVMLMLTAHSANRSLNQRQAFVLTTLSWTIKAAVLCTLLGSGLLLWNTVRLKLRTTHFDRYRGVMR